jgi:hypothetical protein
VCILDCFQWRTDNKIIPMNSIENISLYTAAFQARIERSGSGIAQKIRDACSTIPSSAGTTHFSALAFH